MTINEGYEREGATFVFRSESGRWLGEVSLTAGDYGAWRTAIPRRSGKASTIERALASVRRVLEQ